ncbi:ExeM/NucH family extracellular endonuclease [Phycicoccus sp. Soil802]|uniref:ExeM/NucH family extracellular endonuclease n=1 Tax=Phycicoccus sp. Soil802 TaxID=1736414 RepID=UPI001F36602C|nr:ExeM/NucH family extracellular endonuclease [Phycicoccus sp. Soil802]
MAPTSALGAPSPGAAVVINEVYGGGGNSGATFNRDFIELVNKTTAAVDLSTWSVQYASAAGTSWSTKTNLTGVTIPAGGRVVVGGASGANGAPITADVDGGINLSGSAGKVALVDTQTALPGTTCTDACSDLPQVVDFVGYGTANDWAGAGAAPGTANATSVSRNSTSTNTANNATDFTVGTPTPGAGTPPPPGTPVPKTIAEVQGTGSTSPLVGQNVIVKGVVTAAYPTGGFHGFYLQTQGTGPEPSASGASDGVFVFQSGSSTPLDADAVVGNYVEVTGKVSEFSGLTEVTAAGADIVDAGEDFSPVQALTVPWPITDAGRESLEGMLFQPTGDYTVTNTFGTNQFGEVGLAVGDHPLLQNTEVGAPGSPEAAAVVTDNAKRAVTLDDGASSNFTASSFATSTCGTRPIPCLLNADLTPAYVSNTKPVRVGEAASFSAPVVVDYRFSLWRFQPTAQVVGPDNATSPVSFENTRTAAPDTADINQLGTADLKVASFNVLNYFTDLGDQDPTCLAYYDRDDDGVTVRDGCDRRGAWDAGDLARQTEKEVSAITALDADVVGLMEIENSAKFGHPRDTALAALVAALNAKVGAGTWAFVPSSTDLPSADDQDFITSAIIYQPAKVMRVDRSRALGDQSGPTQAFGNAREPIAQTFKKKTGKADKFLFVVNHFKSKGSAGPFPGDEDTGDGQGASVTSRILQAQALRDWVPGVAAEYGAKAVVMAGDYNSYTMEDPLDVLYRAGYTDVGSTFDPSSYSYSFSGLSGSLDHILVNDHALRMSTGADHWNINSGESVALEYSRYNYHSTDFHQSGPYRSSDHDPVVLGLKAFVQ